MTDLNALRRSDTRHGDNAFDFRQEFGYVVGMSMDQSRYLFSFSSRRGHRASSLRRCPKSVNRPASSQQLHW
jgi:hypothetical protein